MDAAAGGGVVFGGRVGRPAWVSQVRGLPLMTSAKFSDFLTPPLPANSRNLHS